MNHPLADKLCPLGVIFGRIGPTLAVVRLDREGFGHESDFDKRFGVGVNIGVDDAVYNFPVVDGLAARVLCVGVGGSPLEGGGSIACAEKVVRANVDGDVAESGQLAYQLG